jgi:hypothetical protein
MQAIVETAPEAPDIDTAKIPTTSRRPSPVLAMAGAFAFVLLVGVVTSLFIFGNDRGTVPSGGVGDGVATSTSVLPAEPILYGPVPSTWDAVVVIEAGAPIEGDPDLARFVVEAGAVVGVESISVVSPEDLATALGWEDGSAGGVFIMTSGDASAAEQATLLAPDSWKIVLSPVSALENTQQAMDRLKEYSDPITDKLSLGKYSGPEPAFDTAELGDEMPLENAYDGADELPVVLDVFGGLSDSIVYIGSIDGINGFVYGVETDGGTTEICQTAVWAMADAVVSACFDGSEAGLSKMVGMAESADDGIVVAVTALGDGVSVVAVELPGGHRYWQRPVAGSAMFVTTDSGALADITITTYNAAGDLLATDEFNPNA